MKNIVILGASYAGVSTAHRLFKQSAKTGAFKITLVSPNTHFYWNMAAPRALIPGQLEDDQVFQSIEDGFKQYSADQFEFILAAAESLDVDAKTVELSGPTGKRTLAYDYLILATGSRTKDDTPLKGLASTRETKDALHNVQGRVEKASSIVVAGAGVTGIELAGELGSEFGRNKQITLIASESTLLSDCPPSVSKIATNALRDLGVDIKFSTKIMSSSDLKGNRKELILSDGSKLHTDLYIPTFGLTPNSSYLPADLLNANGFVVVDDYLKAAENIWALGDVAAVEGSQFLTCDRQSSYLCKALVATLNNKAPVPYKVASNRFMGLQIGKNAGTGHFGKVRIPSFVIVKARKSLFIDRLKPTVTGTLFDGWLFG